MHVVLVTISSLATTHSSVGSGIYVVVACYKLYQEYIMYSTHGYILTGIVVKINESH